MSLSNTSAATEEESKVRAASDRAPRRIKDRIMKGVHPGEERRDGGRGEEGWQREVNKRCREERG